MHYAAIIKAQPNLKVLLTTKEGKPSVVDVERWGILIYPGHHLIPLDYADDDLTKKINFVMLINPNAVPITEKQMESLCFEAALKLGWISHIQ